MLDVNDKYRNNENTDDLVVAVIYNVFGINITINNIERSHRLEAINNRGNLRSARTNPIPIILRFNSFCNRQEVFKVKRSSKGNQVSLSENLRNTAMELTRETLYLDGMFSVSSHICFDILGPWMLLGYPTRVIVFAYDSFSHDVSFACIPSSPL